jgi:hypothetical protein
MLASDAYLHPQLEMKPIWPGPDGYPWKDSGQRLFTREGLLCRTSPGHLLATWTTGAFCEPVPGNFTMFSRSIDDGATWSEPQVLFRHASLGLFTTELFSPKPGEVHAFLQTYPLGSWMTHINSYRAISRDDGATWEGPHSLPGGVDNVWVNKGIRLASGRWMIPLSWAELIGDEWCEPTHGNPPLDPVVGGKPLAVQTVPYMAEGMVQYRAGNAWSDRNHRYCVGVMVSDDEGQSFRRCGYLKGGLHGWLIEPRVVELEPGHIVMLIRSQQDGRLWRAESTDNGESWSAPERSEIPNPGAKVLILKASDGRIFLVHNPVDPSQEARGRNPLALWVSHDGMKTWQVKTDLVRDPNPRQALNYPDGYVDEEAGELVFLWEDAYTVFFCRLPLDVAE